mmetsp:Transcript_24868/g.52977  ORF Transcript_24868/g.52977 Transcript_24868/m.52977 type:complete len:442 (+) Transcript_24868:100-1425(+)
MMNMGQPAAATAIAQATTPRPGPVLQLHTWFGIIPSHWCDPSPQVWAWACHEYVVNPIWSSIIIGDFVGLWFIVALLAREWQQDREVKAKRLAVPKAQRAKQAWRSLAVSSRLASMRAAQEKHLSSAAAFREGWEHVAEARVNRRDILHKLDFDLKSVMTRAVGPLTMLVVMLLIAFEMKCFFFVVLPWYQLSEEIHWWLSRLLALMPARLLYDLLRTSFSDPGRPVADVSGSLSAAGQRSESMDVELGPPTAVILRRCDRCHGPKPERAHHCSVCRKCVLKMDHHCPVVNNCIGLKNHRSFCLFLFDLLVCCGLMAILMFHLTVQAIFFPTNNMTVPFRLYLAAAFWVNIVIEITIGPFLGFHFIRILSNETTLEYLARSRKQRRPRNAESDGRKSYSRGRWENVAETCGAPPFYVRPFLYFVVEKFIPASLARQAKRSA